MYWKDMQHCGRGQPVMGDYGQLGGGEGIERRKNEVLSMNVMERDAA